MRQKKQNGMEAKILVVDDETVIVETLSYRLAKEGLSVFTAHDGAAALEVAGREQPDLVVLDIMLPGLDGYEVCRTLRAQGFQKPIILVSAKGEEVDKVVGLEVGADDYLTKPFSPRELVARIRAHLRREKIHESALAKRAGGSRSRVQFGPLELFPESREVFVDGQPIALSLKEYDLLFLLVSNAGRVLTTEQIIERVWGYDFDGDSNIVQVTVKRLRDKLKEESRPQKLITTLRGVGYRFAANQNAG